MTLAVATKEVQSLEALAPSIQLMLRACPSPDATLFIPRDQLWRGRINGYWLLHLVGSDPIYIYTNRQALWSVENLRGWLARNDNPSNNWVKFSLTEEGKAARTRLRDALAMTNAAKAVKKVGR